MSSPAGRAKHLQERCRLRAKIRKLREVQEKGGKGTGHMIAYGTWYVVMHPLTL